VICQDTPHLSLHQRRCSPSVMRAT
jgi:hypothetical protein